MENYTDIERELNCALVSLGCLADGFWPIWGWVANASSQPFTSTCNISLNPLPPTKILLKRKKTKGREKETLLNHMSLAASTAWSKLAKGPDEVISSANFLLPQHARKSFSSIFEHIVSLCSPKNLGLEYK